MDVFSLHDSTVPANLDGLASVRLLRCLEVDPAVVVSLVVPISDTTHLPASSLLAKGCPG
jgi:hypothetical protein